MILLYLIGILCSVALFAPAAYIPFYIKWPVALAVVLLIIFFFNLPKKDSIYTTHHNKKKLYNFGLYNPLVMYLAASCYVLGFNFIIPAILVNESVDIVAEIGNIISAISFNPLNNLTIGLILVVVGMLIYWFRNAFRSNAMWVPEKQKVFYTGVTDALREYISRRFGIGAMEMTTAELFEAAKTIEDFPSDMLAELKELFETADFVKFAKYVASDEDNASAVPKAVRFVTQTYQSELERQQAVVTVPRQSS